MARYLAVVEFEVESEIRMKAWRRIMELLENFDEGENEGRVTFREILRVSEYHPEEEEKEDEPEVEEPD